MSLRLKRWNGIAVSEEGFLVVWQPKVGAFGFGGFHHASQPTAGQAVEPVPISNSIQSSQLMNWGSLKGNGVLRSAFVRFELSGLTGDPVEPLDPDIPPDPESEILGALLRFTVTDQGSDSEQLVDFISQVSCVARDLRWSDSFNSLVPKFARGIQPAGFLVASGDSGFPLIDGTADDGFDAGFQMNRTAILGLNRVGGSFQIGPAGQNVFITRFLIRKSGTFFAGENVVARIYRCIADDGSNDAPDPALGPIGGPSNSFAMSGVPNEPADYASQNFFWVESGAVVLPEGRFVVLLEADGWVADGRFLSVKLASSTGGFNSHAVGVSTALDGSAPETLNPGFFSPNYLTSYDYPHTHDNVGGLIAGALREGAPLSPTNNWPSPLAGPFPVFTPIPGAVGTTFDLNITDLMQRYVDRPEYAAEIADLNPIAFALAYDVIEEDHERSADNCLLIMSWRKRVQHCAVATPDVTARAVADGEVLVRAVASGAIAPRAAVTSSGTTLRAQASHLVTARGVATMTVCPKE